MTITRALVELKMLDKKINQAMSEKMIGLYQRKGDMVIDTILKKEDFEKKAKEKVQSLKDLVSRAEKMRLALAKANATNTVEVNGREMTIAEVLVFKDRVVPVLEMIESNLRNQTVRISNSVQQNRANLEQQVARMLEQNLGTDRKADEKAYDAIAKPFIDQNEILVSDAGKVSEYVDTLKEEIDGFVGEVDIVLAEANARIEIDI